MTRQAWAPCAHLQSKACLAHKHRNCRAHSRCLVNNVISFPQCYLPAALGEDSLVVFPFRR